jgi:hypothetical protein
MRVAYQAGVVRALHEAGLRFAHADGTSGGTMNLAMILAGQSPEEMAERWRTLDPRGFVSLLPPRTYARSLRWPALGSASGVVEQVFPHLGIDPARIRVSDGMCGTFNLCNFTTKTNEVIEHRDIDLDLLVAGISLPVLMPAVEHGGSVYTDAVWVRDANVAEAVRRGSDEVWLVWCIGNTGRYHGGPFHQYVHLIEMSATGSLFVDFEGVRVLNATRTRPVRLHVIKPEHPLPLDPDYLRGRVDADTLMASGYRDACRYLDAYTEEGVVWDHAATAMTDPEPGVTLRFDLSGTVRLDSDHAGSVEGSGSTQLRVWGAVQLDDVERVSTETVPVVPVVGHVAIGSAVPAPMVHAELRLDPGGVATLDCSVRWRGDRHHIRAVGRVGPHGGDLDVTLSRHHDGALEDGAVVGRGEVRIGAAAAWRALRSLHATAVATPRGRLQADLRFGRMVAGVLTGGQR